MPTMRPLLAFDHVEVSFNGKPVVHDVSFSVQPGEILGVVGESGSGKSTLVKAAMGILEENGAVTRGDIFYDDKNVCDLSERELRLLCGPEMGMIFQDCLAALCPIRTIGVQIHEAMAAHGRISRAESDRCAVELLAKLNLLDGDRVLASYPFELSGGMGQRVGIAIAMLMEPRLLLADEPTSALDVTAQAQVVKQMAEMRQAFGTAMVVVTHNMGVVAAIADTVLVLKDGCIVEYGPVKDVMERPQHAYTRELLDATPRFRRRAS